MVHGFGPRVLACHILFLTLIFCTFVLADERCALTFSGCPETFNGDTIKVPDNVVKIYSLVHACKASQTIHIGGSGSSSILFVIDNTGSMLGPKGNDPTGARFKVVSALLDTIYAKQPDAQVGLIVFREHLYFDTTTTQYYYTQYFKALHPVLDNSPTQAYLPFMGLSTTYNGKTGIAILKDILTTNATGDSLVYRPLYTRNNNGGETNINGAFIAAKQVFQAASNPPQNQFMIFLSDGEPAGTTQANLDPNWFSTAAGVAGLPTTFTVFFNKAGTQPALLTTMTTNIQNNGYSATNPGSNIWSLANVNYNTLMNLLMNNIISNILVSGNPTKMTLNNSTSTIYIDSSFFFTDSFPIAQTPTLFTMNISYRYVNPTTQILSDTVVPIRFYLERSLQAALPAGLGTVCQQIVPPVGSIPVTATLLDTNHNGHLDRIDITWTADSTITGNPTVANFIQTLVITTLDGKKDTLHAVSIQMDLANKTIHIILSENVGPEYETAWQPNPAITLTNYQMTASGSWFIVTAVVDGASPVIKSVCFVPMPGADTLHVEFSEPLAGQKPAVDPYNSFTLYYQNGTAYPFAVKNPTYKVVGDLVVYDLQAHTLTSADSIVEGNRPAFRLSPCGDVSIIVNYLAVGNPFIPGKTVVPPSLRNPNSTSTSGSRIEVSLIPAIQGDLGKGVTGSLTIFDAVGNVVADRVQMFADATAVKLFWVWDGKTRTGSWAAPGTYLARIVIDDQVRGTKQTLRVNVGIKH